MTHESKQRVSAIRVFALALTCALALTAVAASTASAVTLTPETEEFPTEFDTSGGGIFTQSDKFIRCTGSTAGSGSMENNAHGTATLEFYGCEGKFFIDNWSTCQSRGASSGTIVTNPLAVDLEKLPDGNPGVVLSPLGSEIFAEFDCSVWRFHRKWEGGLIGEITDPGYNQYSQDVTIDFGADGTSQEYTETDDGWETSLISYEKQGAQGYSSGYDLGLDGSVDMEFEEEIELSSADPDPYLVLAPANGFPASATYSTYVAAALEFGDYTIDCSSTSGSGEFDNSESGDVTFTLEGCRDSVWGSTCKSTGQANGTIVTEALQMELTYLSDSSPGFAFKENGASDRVVEFRCLSGFITIRVTGGVLAAILYPELHGTSPWFGFDLNVVGGEQEYTETESSEEVSLEATLNGGAPEPATLGLEGYADFGEYVTLRG